MAHSSYSTRHASRDRARCTTCGARTSYRGSEAAFCTACLDWARQSKLTEWDELGAGD